MTAEENDETGKIDCGEKKTSSEKGVAEQTLELPREILELFEFLSLNEKIVFKSQQIDDPELLPTEKVEIAREIYAKNRQTFLMRFGDYFEERHLEVFARLALADGAAPMRSDEHYEEMQFMLKNYQHKLHTRKRDVKNRRYTALQQMVAKGEYFSEQEMMKRAPELYQELVGQYLSEAEKKQRDSYDVKNTTFSGILMHTMEKKQMEDMLRQADEKNKSKSILEVQDHEIKQALSESSNCSASTITETEIPDKFGNDLDEEVNDVPVACRQQWGNFDTEQIACSTSQIRPISLKKSIAPKIKSIKSKSNPDTFITAGERDLLRQEFIGLMHEQFLSGNDKEFDYSQVDDNSQLDDLRQLNQDKEDEYFEDSDEYDDEENPTHEDNEEDIKRMDESEDELDIYMSHLNKHHSLQK